MKFAFPFLEPFMMYSKKDHLMQLDNLKLILKILICSISR